MRAGAERLWGTENKGPAEISASQGLRESRGLNCSRSPRHALPAWAPQHSKQPPEQWLIPELPGHNLARRPHAPSLPLPTP